MIVKSKHFTYIVGTSLAAQDTAPISADSIKVDEGSRAWSDCRNASEGRCFPNLHVLHNRGHRQTFYSYEFKELNFAIG